MTISQGLCTEVFILRTHSQAAWHSCVHPGYTLQGSFLNFFAGNSTKKIHILRFFLQQHGSSVGPYRSPAGQGCNWKRGGNSLPAHISLCRARGPQGWAVSGQDQLKNFSAIDVLLNKTLTCHKHDLSLEFVIGSNFSAGKDFSWREQDLPQQRWQRHLWVTPCPGIEPCARGGKNCCSISLWCGRFTFKFLPLRKMRFHLQRRELLASWVLSLNKKHY